ncbi:SusC/RagA family TonB-linked outer membrane protein [Fulvitalea axinellae]|uniref:SusC/RagA family TonB-linked outer membrane protein n=1 Tax=Fulvitalea axinellae TaxID=1182444 RepID=A0AAU9CM74_9BACT|nr:SusC/RagA family TonB-linked outer membrane protein [Fulvitalea axinellae]
MRNFYFLMICWLLSLSGALAQDRVIVKGYVKSDADAEPLIGVNITEVDHEGRFVSGTVTDFNGFYMLKINPANTIRFAYVGFNAEERKVGTTSELNISLKENTTQLEVVTVEADEVASDGIKLRDVPMSIQKVKVAELEQLGAISVDQMLQGQISGVDIMAVSGDPGAGMQIRIRGTSTILGNQEPLIVVDGIPFETDIQEDFDFASADARDFGALLAIAPEDIESIEVLKDAASAARWGSRAANGVLQVITKKGVRGKPRLTYSVKGTISTQPDPVPMLSGPEYVTLQKEMYFNRNGNIHGTTFRGLNYDTSWDQYYNYAQDTDWLDEITKVAFSQEHNFSLSGGGEKVLYRVSVGYGKNDGTTMGTNFDRLTVGAKLDYTISTRLKFNTDISYTRSDSDAPYYSNLRSIAYRKMPNMSVYEYDAEGMRTGEYFNDDWRDPYQTFKTTIDGDEVEVPMYNPVAMANESFNNSLNDRLRTNFRLTYFLLDDLMVQGIVSFDVSGSKREQLLSSAAANEGGWNHVSKNRVVGSSGSAFTARTYTTVSYTPDWGEKHDFSTRVRWESAETSSSGFSTSTGNLPFEGISNPGTDGSSRKVSSSTNTRRDLGGLVSTYYKYDDRYMVSGGLRIDASSNFGEDTRWGAFPFVGVAWRLMNENFLRNVKQLDELKLTGSFGVNGTAPNGSGRYANYKAGARYLTEPAIYSSNIQLRNLAWETKTAWNVALTAAAFENRVNVQLEYYRNKSEDLFWNVGLPASSGFGKDTKYDQYRQNAGAMLNKGIEFSLSATPIKAEDPKDLNVNFTFNISKNINKVLALPDNYSLEAGNVFKNGEYSRRVEIGNPIGGFYGYRSLGVYEDKDATIARDRDGNPIPDYTGQYDYLTMKMGGTANYTFVEGDARYEDVNKDGYIDENDIVYLGSSNPDFSGGFRFQVRYMNFALSSSFHFRSGFDIVNGNRISTESMSSTNNQSVATLRRWRRPGDETDIPRTIYGTNFNTLGSDRFVEDGSFLRWKNVSLSYRFDQKFLKRLHLSALSAFATAYNLYTFTNYSGQDPEVSFGSDPFFMGVDNDQTPPSRSFVFGLSATF